MHRFAMLGHKDEHAQLAFAHFLDDSAKVEALVTLMLELGSQPWRSPPESDSVCETGGGNLGASIEFPVST